MSDKIIQRLVDPCFGITALDLYTLTVNIELRVLYRLFQFFQGNGLQLSGLGKLVTNNGLDGIGQLYHILLLDIFTDLHGAFQRIIIGCISKRDNSLPL